MKPILNAASFLACSVVLLPLGATAQTSAPQPAETLSNGNLIHTLEAAPVLNAPFSAQATHETVKTLQDGTQVRSGGHHFIARDSQGRTRVEMRYGTKANEMRLVFVSDPVAHTITTWSEGGTSKPLASVTKLPANPPAPPQRMAAARSVEDGRPQPIITRQELGAATVEGVSTDDVKITTVVPVGRAGNSAPITKTEETWTSPDLKLIVKQQWMDPRTGVRTQQLEHLSRAEPDSKLFHPPVGYQVKDTAETLRDLAAKLNAAADTAERR
jgi:hypothetical protein